MKKYALLAVLLLSAVAVHAQSWDFGNGIVLALPTTPAAAMPILGGDVITKQAIVGTAARFATLWKTLNADGGLVGEFNSNAPNVQPYAALGFDILRFFPGIPATGLELQAGTRYVASTSANHHIGATAALAYNFQPVPAPVAPVAAPVPVTSKLNLFYAGQGNS